MAHDSFCTWETILFIYRRGTEINVLFMSAIGSSGAAPLSVSIDIMILKLFIDHIQTADDILPLAKNIILSNKTIIHPCLVCLFDF